MNCSRVVENLSAFVDGELTKRESLQVQAHLADCITCRRQFETLETLQFGLAEALERIVEAPDMVDDVMMLLPTIHRKPVRWVPWALVAACLAAFAMTAMILYRHPSQSRPIVMQARIQPVVSQPVPQVKPQRNSVVTSTLPEHSHVQRESLKRTHISAVQPTTVKPTLAKPSPVRAERVRIALRNTAAEPENPVSAKVSQHPNSQTGTPSHEEVARENDRQHVDIVTKAVVDGHLLCESQDTIYVLSPNRDAARAVRPQLRSIADISSDSGDRGL